MDRRLLAVLVLLCLGLFAMPACFGEDVPETPLEDPGVASTGRSTETETATAEGTATPKPHTPRAGAQKYEFQAEVARLMDIIINSLYSNKDVFLRELISNAADALDKIRFLSLTDKSILGEGDNEKLEIRISADKGKNMLTIRDRGIGMTKDELVKNLGTIAKSGTAAFLEQMQKGGDVNLIGQFGVGFYSVYLVADYLEVISKNNADKQYIWESGADGNFAVSEDLEGEPLGRGTLINIYLKEDAAEYLEDVKLKELVQHYSEFINFPIYLLTTKTVEKEVAADDDDADVEPADAKNDDADIEDEDDKDDEDKPKTKKVSEEVTDWEQLNTQKAIWTRDPKDVTKEEYENFYKSIAKATDSPAAYAHFKAEGDVEFKAIMYLPSKAPYDFMDNYYNRKENFKLYVRRVFISDDFEDLIPKYLRWIYGLVDSDTLPLNVNRENLQAHSSLKTIRKKLVRKALDMIRKLADQEKKAEEGGDDDDKSGDEGDKPEFGVTYTQLWKEFGKAIKMGVVEDTANRGRLAKLLRFHTSKSPDKLTSLDEYMSRMKDDQKSIYYISGQSQQEVANSPFTEKLVQKDYEVIYFTDALDEYVMGNLKEFEDKTFQDATKEDLKLGKDAKDKKRDKKLKEQYKDLTKWWKEQLGSGVQGVVLSKRLHTTPCVVVTSKYGWSANMERIMKAQAMGDAEKQSYMKGQKTLEINPHHPLIQELKSEHDANPDAEQTQSLAKLLYETALLESGFGLDDPKAFNKRVYGLVKEVLKIERDLDTIDNEADVADEDEKAADEKAADETVTPSGKPLDEKAAEEAKEETTTSADGSAAEDSGAAEDDRDEL